MKAKELGAWCATCGEVLVLTNHGMRCERCAAPPVATPSATLTREEFTQYVMNNCQNGGCGGDYPPCRICSALLTHDAALRERVATLDAENKLLLQRLTERTKETIELQRKLREQRSKEALR